MLDQQFLETLEYKISAALESIDDESASGFWCDGIAQSEPDSHYSQKSLNDNHQIELQAFIGKDGQTPYTLTLKFGRKALSKYARNLDITQCIPETLPANWFYIDVEKKRLVIQLD